jgi:hypothetical protein
MPISDVIRDGQHPCAKIALSADCIAGDGSRHEARLIVSIIC